MKYFGWIPNTSGTISFSSFGHIKSFFGTNYINVADRDTRYVVSHERRWLSDAAIPLLSSLPVFRELANRLFLGSSGLFYFVCVCRGQGRLPKNDGFLEGRVFVFTRSRWEASAKHRFKEYKEYLKKYESGNELTSYFSSTYNRAMNDLAIECEDFVGFILGRDGVVELNYVNEASRPEITFRTSRAAREESSEEVWLLLSQSFNYLKDAAHAHCFHHPKTDTLVRLERTTVEGEWISFSAARLLKKIIEFKKENVLNTFNSALGIIPYTKALCKIADKKYSGTYIPLFDDENLKNVLELKREIYIEAGKNKKQGSDFITALVIAVIAASFSFVSVLSLNNRDDKSNIKVNTDILRIAETIVENPKIALMYVVAVGVFLFCVRGLYVNGLDHYKNNEVNRILVKSYRDLLRLVAPNGKVSYCAVMLILSLIGLLLGLYFLAASYAKFLAY